jgi:hypothetical protein
MTRGALGALLAALGAGAGFGALYLYERSRTGTLPPTLTPPSTGGPPPSQQPSTPPSYTPPSTTPPSSPPTTGLTCGQQILMGQLLLQYGSTGPCVQQLQALLDQWGSRYGYAGFPNNAAIAQDGEFGPLTLAAVEAFQSRVGITVDGIVGPVTWGHLTSMTPPTAPSSQQPSQGSSSGTPGLACPAGYFQKTFYQINYPLGVYNGEWIVCLPNVPSQLPSSVSGGMGCMVWLSLGPVKTLHQVGGASLPSGTTVYGVARYVSRDLVEVYLQTNDPGPAGTFQSDLSCYPFQVAQGYVPLPYPA